jgi:paraquat-inducible protein B
MSSRISPTAIGVFVTGAIAIVVVAILIVVGGKLFQKPQRFVCMFPGDVNGLKVGAPVKFRGVQVGTVEVIKLRLSPSEGKLRPGTTKFLLPVIIGIDRSLLVQQGGTGEALTKSGFEDMLQSGLRAQLDVESLLTGLLYVDLNLHKDEPLNLALVPGVGNLREIPTIPTTMEAVQAKAMEAIAKFDEIDFKALVASITAAANSFQQLASSTSLKETLVSLRQTSDSMNKTMVAITRVTDNANAKIGPLVESLQQSSAQANATMKDTQATLVELQSTLDPDSPLSVHLNEALDELADTSRSVGELSSYLQRNPASLIRGRYVSQKDRAQQ